MMINCMCFLIKTQKLDGLEPLIPDSLIKGKLIFNPWLGVLDNILSKRYQKNVTRKRATLNNLP